jgi:hypothetical protein
MADLNPILKSWTAGFVRRWHTNPELCDTVDYDSGHQQRCALLLLGFWPGCSRNALVRALIHDQGECDAGDMAHPAKVKHPVIAELVWDVELDSIEQKQNLHWPQLAPYEQKRQRFVDYLDSYLWMWRHKPTMMRKPQWENHANELGEQALALGILVEFDDFMINAYQFFSPE